MPDDAAYVARWTVAPLVSSVLAAIARDRRCAVEQLSATLSSEVETAALAWYAAYLRDQDRDKTPTRDLWDADHPSKTPTVPASPPPVPPPPMPRGVKR